MSLIEQLAKRIWGMAETTIEHFVETHESPFLKIDIYAYSSVIEDARLVKLYQVRLAFVYPEENIRAIVELKYHRPSWVLTSLRAVLPENGLIDNELLVVMLKDIAVEIINNQDDLDYCEMKFLELYLILSKQW